MTSEVMANGTKEKWDPGENQRQQSSVFFVMLYNPLMIS